MQEPNGVATNCTKKIPAISKTREYPTKNDEKKPTGNKTLHQTSSHDLLPPSKNLAVNRGNEREVATSNLHFVFLDSSGARRFPLSRSHPVVVCSNCREK